MFKFDIFYYLRWFICKYLILIFDMINSYLVYLLIVFNFFCLKYLIILIIILLMYFKKEKKILFNVLNLNKLIFFLWSFCFNI